MITPAVANELTITLLLLTLGIVLAIASALGLLVRKQARNHRDAAGAPQAADPSHRWQLGSMSSSFALDSPSRWCAIRSSSVQAVQSELGLHNPRSCSWGEGMSLLAEHCLLISPPIHGWVLVIGHGLPDPADDVDECFRFLQNLSRSLDHVQFFSVNHAVNHHAWVRIEEGEIRRAYAWAGETLWNQGHITDAEIELGLKCLDYGESPGDRDISPNDLLQANIDKIHLLASRWSLDPARIGGRMANSGLGIVGEMVHSRHR